MTRSPLLALRRRRIRAGPRSDGRGTNGSDHDPLLDEDTLRLIGRLALENQGSLTEWLAGEHTGRRKAQAIEFEDYRGYVPGDDFRQIDWHAYARLGELFVKTSLAPESVTLSLLIDCSRSMDWGRPNKLRYAKRLAAAVGAVALLRSDAVRLYALADGGAFPGPSLQGPGALHALSDELERMAVGASTDLPSSVEAYGRFTDPRGIIMLLSDLLVPPESIAALGALVADTTAAAVLHIVDPAEALPSTEGSVELHDAESAEALTVTVTPAMRRRYAQAFEARAQEIEAACGAQQVRYLRVHTGDPPAEVVAGMLRRAHLIQT